jgi:hypothetical protein
MVSNEFGKVWKNSKSPNLFLEMKNLFFHSPSSVFVCPAHSSGFSSSGLLSLGLKLAKPTNTASPKPILNDTATRFGPIQPPIRHDPAEAPPVQIPAGLPPPPCETPVRTRRGEDGSF